MMKREAIGASLPLNDVFPANLFATLERWERTFPLVPLGLFLLSLTVLLRTICPTVYQLDSAELATGAYLLGIVHAPGYPLYTIVAHMFTLLPFGDVAFRVNLFSAVSLALTVSVLYSLIHKLVDDRWIAATVALAFAWSYYAWDSGTAAEIYAPQLLGLALCGWSLAAMYRDYRQNEWKNPPSGALRTGMLFGIAVALAPSSVMFGPGLALAFLLMRISWRNCLLSAALSVVVVLSVLLYFPLRADAFPDFNKIGFYDAQGAFHNVNYHTLQGIWLAVSARQFHSLFFADGFLPTFSRLSLGFSWLWRNYLGIGVLFGLLGGVYLLRARRGLLLGWLGLTVPYTYFYICYGAIDRDTMFNPTYLAWAVLLAFGLRWSLRVLPGWFKPAILIGLPLLALVVNFSAVDLSGDSLVRDHAEAVIRALPPNAVIAGYWPDVTPLQYLHFVEHVRPDIKIYDLFMFSPADFRAYTDALGRSGQKPVVLTPTAILSIPDTSYQIVPIWAYMPGDYQGVKFPFLASFLLGKLRTTPLSAINARNLPIVSMRKSP